MAIINILVQFLRIVVVENCRQPVLLGKVMVQSGVCLFLPERSRVVVLKIVEPSVVEPGEIGLGKKVENGVQTGLADLTCGDDISRKLLRSTAITIG